MFLPALILDKTNLPNSVAVEHICRIVLLKNKIKIESTSLHMLNSAILNGVELIETFWQRF